jgi:hypothetical protein
MLDIIIIIIIIIIITVIQSYKDESIQRKSSRL